MSEFVPVAPPVPAGDDEATHVDTSAAEPVELDDDESRSERVPVGEQQPGRSIPAGHLLIGALSTLVLGGWAAWEWLGVTGLLTAGGGIAAAGGGYGYWRWRSAHPGDARRLASVLGLGRSRRGDMPGGAGGVGRRMTFGTGGRRSGGSRIPSPFASTGASRAGRRVPLSRTPGSTPSGRAARRVLDRLSTGSSGRGGRGAFRPLGHAERTRQRSQGVGRAARGLRAAIGRTTRRARTRGRAINSEWTEAARRLSTQAGRGFRQAGRRMRGVDHLWSAGARRLASVTRRRSGRIGRWFDRRTGRVTSLGWKALVNGDQAGWDALRNAYRRWDAQTLFGLLTITERATRGLRSWWRRHHSDTTTKEASPTASPLNPERPIVAGARPIYRRNTLSGLNLPGGGVSPLVAMSAEMVAGVARFLPPDMWWVAADLEQLDQVTSNVAAALRTYARNLDAGYPIDPRIIEMFDEFTTHVGKTSDYPLAIVTAFKQIHETDIKRRLLPRTNEHLWNV